MSDEERRWLDGRAFRDWLWERGVRSIDLTVNQQRACGRWKADGCRVDFYELPDEILTRVDLHEWEIPDEVWVRERRLNRSRWNGFREEGERLLCQGLSGAFVARDLGVPVKVVAGWKRELRLAGKIGA